MAEQRIAVPSGAVDGSAMSALEGTRAVTAEFAHDMSILGMFLQADWVVKLVILMLIASSFWCWKIIFEKWRRYREVDSRMQEFERSVWSGEPLEAKYEKMKSVATYPLARVFVAGMYEWLTALKNIKLSRSKRQDPQQMTFDVDPLQPSEANIKQTISERVMNAMESTKNREIAQLEAELGFLATVGSAAPFVGLFGTVWGIMRSFQSIAVTQNTTLAVVAPGIAEALFATAIGLFAAIPAVIFYNKFANQVASFNDRLDHFIDEFSAVMGRELDKG